MTRPIGHGILSAVLALLLVSVSAGRVVAETPEGAAAGADAPAGEHGAAHHREPRFSWFTWSVDDAEVEDPGHDYGPGFFWAIINFAALLIVLSWLLGKPVRQFVLDRHHKVRDAIDEAKKARDRAEERHREYLQKIEKLDADAKEIENKILGEARREANRIIDRAKERSERLVGDAERAVKAEIHVAKKALEQEVARAALAAAEKLVRGTLDKDDKRRLEDEFLKQVSA